MADRWSSDDDDDDDADEQCVGGRDEELYLAFADDAPAPSPHDNGEAKEGNDDGNDDEEDGDPFAALGNFVGGAPLWLKSDSLPSDAQLQCTQCNNEPLVQLLQI